MNRRGPSWETGKLRHQCVFWAKFFCDLAKGYADVAGILDIMGRALCQHQLGQGCRGRLTVTPGHADQVASKDFPAQLTSVIIGVPFPRTWPPGVIVRDSRVLTTTAKSRSAKLNGLLPVITSIPSSSKPATTVGSWGVFMSLAVTCAPSLTSRWAALRPNPEANHQYVFP